ncbi:Na+/H+ antiporter NhaA [Streptomyces sp. NPDC004675]|uniref:Na+/H+ antiporter NhaA n=1 Tax=Streptomyces sp. NPDC004675 TaxID=3154286 RepID=UPI0033B7588C
MYGKLAFSAAVAVPVFALMTAGVSWSGAKGFWQSTTTWGVLGGMLVGKFLGVFGASWLTARFTSARLNPLLAWPDIAGIGVLAGIGFTVCLLFAELSYDNVAYLSQAKGAVLLSSASAALLAALILGRRSTHRRRMRERHGAG